LTKDLNIIFYITINTCFEIYTTHIKKNVSRVSKHFKSCSN